MAWDLSDTAPKMFTRIFIVRVLVESTTVPVAYVFFEDKATSSYERAPTWEPSYVILDFELAELNAAKIVLPGSTRGGCNFHYAQALMRRFKKVKGYGTTSRFAEMANTPYALPFFLL